MTAEDASRMADVESANGVTLPRGRALTSGEIAALFRPVAPLDGMSRKEASRPSVLLIPSHAIS